MHIEVTGLLRCPEPHEQQHLVLSTGEMRGRMVRSGTMGCPVCRREYPIREGVVEFGGRGRREGGRAEEGTHPPSPSPLPGYPDTLQALLDLSGPGGVVVLVGYAARYAAGLATLMAGIHFIGVNAPAGVAELPVLTLLDAEATVPLRDAVARGVVLAADVARDPWLAEGCRVLLRGRRLVVEDEHAGPPGIRKLAAGERLFVGEKV